MAIDLKAGVVLGLKFSQDSTLEYRCKSTVLQEFVSNGSLLGRKEHNWETRVSQRFIRVEQGLAHILTVSEPIGEAPEEPICGAQVHRQVVYAQMDEQGMIRETAGSFNTGSYAFPKEPVTEGSCWKAPALMILPGMPTPCRVENTYTVVGVEQVCGFECVRINVESTRASFEMTLPGNGQQARVESVNKGALFLAPRLGVLVRIETESSSVPHISDFVFRTESKVVQELVKFDVPA